MYCCYRLMDYILLSLGLGRAKIRDFIKTKFKVIVTGCGYFYIRSRKI